MTGQKGDPIFDRKAWPRRNGTRFRLRTASLIGALASVSSPHSDGPSDRKAWPDTASDSDPCLQPGMRQTPAHCSSPTGAIRVDWDQQTGDALNPCSLLFSDWRDQSQLGSTDRGRPLSKDQQTDGESKAGRTSHNQNTGDRILYTCRK